MQKIWESAEKNSQKVQKNLQKKIKYANYLLEKIIKICAFSQILPLVKKSFCLNCQKIS